MATRLEISPVTEGQEEAARLTDPEAAPVASVLEPGVEMEPAAFREAVIVAALELNDRGEGEPVAGVLFAARWGGGGDMLT
jgi:hypothetical protein